jgi:two-component system sensor histidine kinase GlrK
MAYPRSFLGLLLTGFTAVALPLGGAFAYSAWNTERLAEQSRSAVFSASQAARNRTEFYRLLERHSLEQAMFKAA